MNTHKPTPAHARLMGVVKKFEHAIIIALIVMLMVVISLSTYELGYIIVKDTFTPPIFLLDLDELLEIFSFLLLIIIGIELLETIKAYLKDNVIHIEIVVEVALIAIARKVIVLDLDKYDGLSVLAVAALVLALAAGSYLQRKSIAHYQPQGNRIDSATDPSDKT